MDLQKHVLIVYARGCVTLLLKAWTLVMYYDALGKHEIIHIFYLNILLVILL